MPTKARMTNTRGRDVSAGFSRGGSGATPKVHRGPRSTPKAAQAVTKVTLAKATAKKGLVGSMPDKVTYTKGKGTTVNEPGLFGLPRIQRRRGSVARMAK